MLYLRCVLNHYVPDNSPVLFGFCIQVDIRRPAECGLVGSVSAIGSRFAAEEYGSLAIVDPHLKREGFDDKPGVLDVKMNTKSGEVTDAEIQVENVPQMRERLVFYAARMNGARAEGWKAGITEGEEIEKLREYPIT